MVDGDAQRLKSPCGGVDVLRAVAADLLDDAGELQCRIEWAVTYYGTCNAPGVAFFTVSPDHVRQFGFGGMVDQCLRADGLGRIEAHIQWSIVLK